MAPSASGAVPLTAPVTEFSSCQVPPFNSACAGAIDAANMISNVSKKCTTLFTCRFPSMSDSYPFSFSVVIQPTLLSARLSKVRGKYHSPQGVVC